MIDNLNFKTEAEVIDLLDLEKEGFIPDCQLGEVFSANVKYILNIIAETSIKECFGLYTFNSTCWIKGDMKDDVFINIDEMRFVIAFSRNDILEDNPCFFVLFNNEIDEDGEAFLNDYGMLITPMTYKEDFKENIYMAAQIICDGKSIMESMMKVMTDELSFSEFFNLNLEELENER